MLRTPRWAALVALLLPISLLEGACAGEGEPSAGAGGTGALPECLGLADLYALTGPESEGFQRWDDAQQLVSELGSDTELPDEPLTVVGPGEESGTYDTFVELVIEEFSDDRGAEAQTRTDYLSSPNDNVIVQNLSSTESALGWVGYAFFIENQADLDAFAVAGEDGECVEPAPETIASGAYALSRPLYIYVNEAKAARSGTLSAYIDLYLGDLYDCVVQAGYVRLAQDALDETRQKWEATQLSGGEPDGAALEISGSSTVEPISQCVLEMSGFAGAVEGPGTGDGFKRFCAGETDISDASRAIKESEAETCAENGIEYTELQVAVDGIVVMAAA